MSKRTKRRKIIVLIFLAAALTGIVVMMGSLFRVRFVGKPMGYIMKEEDGSVEAFIYTSVKNGSFTEQTIRFEVGGGTEYQDGYLKSEGYYDVQIELRDDSAGVSVNGDCITIPSRATVFLLITARNEYIGAEYEGEQVGLRREAPEDVRIIVVSGGGTRNQTNTDDMASGLSYSVFSLQNLQGIHSYEAGRVCSYKVT